MKLNQITSDGKQNCHYSQYNKITQSYFVHTHNSTEVPPNNLHLGSYGPVKVYDKIDGLIDWGIKQGAICVAGTSDQIKSIQSYLQQKFKRDIGVLTPLDYLNTIRKETNPAINNLILIGFDTEKYYPRHISSIASQCDKSLIFRPQNMMIFSRSSDRYYIKPRAMGIVGQFADVAGVEKHNFLEIMHAVDKDEFLEIGKGETRIRKIPKLKTRFIPARERPSNSGNNRRISDDTTVARENPCEMRPSHLVHT